MASVDDIAWLLACRRVGPAGAQFARELNLELWETSKRDAQAVLDLIKTGTPDAGDLWWDPADLETGCSDAAEAFENATYDAPDDLLSGPVQLSRAMRLSDVWAVSFGGFTHCFATEADARAALEAAPKESET